MKFFSIVVACLCLYGCGEGEEPPAPDVETTDAKYTTSQPLKDNTDSISQNILLMGNSHAIGTQSILEEILDQGQPTKSINVELAPGSKFLVDRVNDGESEQALESNPWTVVVLQAQKYSSSGANSYPTTAAEYWIRGVKELGATPVLFPEHPRRGNNWEVEFLFELHSGIAQRENACVAPVGLVWEEALLRDDALELYQADGNHASEAGLFLTSLVFYEIISGEPATSLTDTAGTSIPAATQQLMRDVVSDIIYLYPPCRYD